MLTSVTSYDEVTGPRLTFGPKQLENWAEAMKQLFSDVGKQAAQGLWSLIKRETNAMFPTLAQGVCRDKIPQKGLQVQYSLSVLHS